MIKKKVNTTLSIDNSYISHKRKKKTGRHLDQGCVVWDPSKQISIYDKLHWAYTLGTSPPIESSSPPSSYDSSRARPIHEEIYDHQTHRSLHQTYSTGPRIFEIFPIRLIAQ